MRIVLDTNILTRAFATPTGPAGKVLELLRSPHLLIVSTHILSELADVLGRENLRKLHGQSDDAINSFLQRIETAALVVTLTEHEVPAIVEADREDDFVIAAAVEGKAEMICTRDKHFSHPQVIQYCRDRFIEIIGDVELVELLR